MIRKPKRPRLQWLFYRYWRIRHIIEWDIIGSMRVRADLKYCKKSCDIKTQVIEATADAVLPNFGFVKDGYFWRKGRGDKALFSPDSALAEIFRPEIYE